MIPKRLHPRSGPEPTGQESNGECFQQGLYCREAGQQSRPKLTTNLTLRSHIRDPGVRVNSDAIRSQHDNFGRTTDPEAGKTAKGAAVRSVMAPPRRTPRPTPLIGTGPPPTC